MALPQRVVGMESHPQHSGHSPELLELQEKPGHCCWTLGLVVLCGHRSWTWRSRFSFVYLMVALCDSLWSAVWRRRG